MHLLFYKEIFISFKSIYIEGYIMELDRTNHIVSGDSLVTNSCHKKSGNPGRMIVLSGGNSIFVQNHLK